MDPKTVALARKHFKKADPHFFNHISNIQILDFKEHQLTDLYHSLVRAIMGQQLSTKAAQTIYERFLSLFESGYPEPIKLVNLSDQVLKSKGVSRQKAGYIRNVAQFFLDKNWQIEDVCHMDDQFLMKQLTSIKGVGIWTVQMLLMFTLNRADIMPVDDLGIQKSMKKIYALDLTGKELKNEMLKIASPWSPYRTIGCMYLWRFVDGGEPIK